MFANAAAYDQFMGRWSRLLVPEFLAFAELFAAGPRVRVLDAGTGIGSAALGVAERYPEAEVVGIDPSMEYVSETSERARALGDRVRFEVADAQALPFEDGSFDGAVSLLVFNFLPDPARALAELRRVVKPGGAITAAVWDYGDGMGMLRTFWDAVVATDPNAEKRDERHMKLCRSGELNELWRGAGLRDVREQPLEIETSFSGFDDYWSGFLLGQGPAGAYVSGLTEDQRETLRMELQRRLPGEGRIALPARAWAVRGTV